MEKQEIENAIGDLIEKEMGKIGDRCGVLEIGEKKYAIFTEDSGEEILKLLDMIFEETYLLCSQDKKVAEDNTNVIDEEELADKKAEEVKINLRSFQCPGCGNIIEGIDAPTECFCGRRGEFTEIKDAEDLK